MSATGAGRDLDFDEALRVVRRRHRQVKKSKRLGLRALREAKRLQTVTRCELMLFPYAANAAQHLDERPSKGAWEKARTDLQRSSPDRRTAKDLTWIRWTAEAPYSEDDWCAAVSLASAAYYAVILETRTARGDRKVTQDVRTRRSRADKKAMRRSAEATFNASLAGLATGVTSVRNSGLSSMRTVAAGSTLRT